MDVSVTLPTAMKSGLKEQNPSQVRNLCVTLPTAMKSGLKNGPPLKNGASYIPHRDEKRTETFLYCYIPHRDEKRTESAIAYPFV